MDGAAEPPTCQAWSLSTPSSAPSPARARKPNTRIERDPLLTADLPPRGRGYPLPTPARLLYASKSIAIHDGSHRTQQAYTLLIPGSSRGDAKWNIANATVALTFVYQR